jgi:hypothetical protein
MTQYFSEQMHADFYFCNNDDIVGARESENLKQRA